MYRAVIFDLDGTLLNTLEDLRDGVNYVLALRGYPERSLEEIRRFVGNGIGKLIERAVPEGVTELAKYYFSEYITVAIGECEGVQKKPSPDSVFKAISLLGVEKEQAVYVGDSDVDRATAANAGMDCVSVTWGFRNEELLKSLEPEYLIHKPEELIGIIENSVDE